MATRAGSVDRGAVIALLLAAPLALGVVVAWAPLKEMFPVAVPEEPDTPPRTKSKGKAPGPKKRDEVPAKGQPPAPAPETPRGWGFEVAPPPHTADQARALRGCRLLAQAIDAYATAAANPGTSDVERFPTSVKDLVEPPFGGPSFLPNGAADLTDPWGQSYTAQLDLPKDGKPRLLIGTTAPDGTRISQFGIGPASDPKD